jgi:ligand-binding sensor domain-containing protein
MSSCTRIGKKNLIDRMLEMAVCGLLLAGLLSGCVTQTPGGLTSTATPEPTSTLLATITVSPVVTVTQPAAPTSTAVQIEPSVTEVPDQRPASGWKLFSNPDFVNGVAAEHQRVWAATSGGVLLWDLESEERQLFTTSDGLVEIQGNDVIYCPLPEEQVIVAHETGVLSVYSLARGKWDQIPITFEDGSTLVSVQALVCDSGGERLVAASRSGLGILDWKTRAWRRMDQADGLNLADIRSVAMRGQSIWIAAGRVGGYLILGSTAFSLNRESGLPAGDMLDVTLSSDGYTWFGYPTGLVRYKDRVWTPYSSTGQNGIPFTSIDQVEVGPDGKIWIGSANEGACPFDPKLIQCATIYPDTPGFPLTDLSSGEWGTLVGTDGDGVRVLSEDQVLRLTYDGDQLSSNIIYDLAEDGQGRLWVVTASGIDILDLAQPQLPWEHIVPGANQGISGSVAGLQPAPNGIWLYYQAQRYASFYDGQSWSRPDKFNGLTGQVLDTAIDQRGYVWFATDQGLNMWDGISMRGYDSTTTGLPTDRFQALLAVDGSMWVGTDRGLLRFNRFTWELALPGVSVQSIAVEGSDELLLGTDQGLIRFRDGQAYYWIVNLGKDVYLSPNITDVIVDKQGKVWAGSAGDGLFVYDGSTWQHFTTANGLPANSIQSIYLDKLGGVWIAATTGAGGGGLLHYMP